MDKKQPETELLDIEFHSVVESYEKDISYDTCSADCYDAIVAFPCTTNLIDRRECCVRIAQATREYAEFTVSTGEWIASIADNWARGIKGDRVKNDWMDMHWNMIEQAKYLAKALRHLALADMAFTTEVRIRHLAAVFCNANILWRHCHNHNNI